MQQRLLRLYRPVVLIVKVYDPLFALCIARSRILGCDERMRAPIHSAVGRLLARRGAGTDADAKWLAKLELDVTGLLRQSQRKRIDGTADTNDVLFDFRS